MSRYDEMKGNMQALYEEAIKELQEIEQKKQMILKDLEFLGPICGKKANSVKAAKAAESAPAAPAAAAAKPKKAKAAKRAAAPAAAERVVKKERIKEERIRKLVMDSLAEAYPNSLTASEIFDKLAKDNLPNTPSFHTRVYGKLGVWTQEGLLSRIERGVYRLVKSDN